MKDIDIILVSDPGCDDAIAIMSALFSEKINIKLMAIAGGNGPIENATNNALFLLDLFQRDIPVAVGLDHPLKRPPTFATKAQGKSGLGGITVRANKLKHKTLDVTACDAMYNVLKAHKKKMPIVVISPMTPVAELLEKYPDSKKYISEIIFVGGSKEKIYGRPYKEFNIGFDPESAEIVLSSKIPLVMVPMELGHFAYLDKNDIKKIKKTNKIGKLFAKMFKKYQDFHVGKLGAAVHDSCSIFYLTNPENIHTEKARIELKYYKEGDLNYGYINCEFDGEPNATLCVDMDIDEFKESLFLSLINAGESVLKNK